MQIRRNRQQGIHGLCEFLRLRFATVDGDVCHVFLDILGKSRPTNKGTTVLDISASVHASYLNALKPRLVVNSL